MVERKISNLSAGVRFPYPAHLAYRRDERGSPFRRPARLQKERGTSPKGRAARSIQMYYIYILLSLKDNRTYVGYTNNIERRLRQHNSGLVKSTKHRIPFKLLFKEEFITSFEAKKRESYWKSGAGRKKLKVLFVTLLSHSIFRGVIT